MAESYRGLTISIGGDTTKLTKALHTANQAISGTQSELKRLGQAVKLDPSSMDAMKLQMGAMAAQASNTAMRIIDLNKALEEVGNTPVGDTNIKALAEATRSAQLDAAVAVSQYKEMTTALATIDTRVTAIAQSATKLTATRLKDALTFDRTSLDEGKKSIDDIKKAFESLPDYVNVNKTAINEYIKRVSELKKEYEEADKASEKNSIVRQLNQLGKEMASFKLPEFNFEKGTNDAEKMRKILQQIAADGFIDDKELQLSDEEIVKIYNDLTRLKPAFEALREEVSTKKKIAMFEDLDVEATKAAASFKSLNKGLAELEVPSKAATSMVELTSHIDALDGKLKASMSELASLDQAIKLNPSNIDLVKRREEVLAEATKLVNEQLDLQKQKLESYDGAGIAASADKDKSAAEQAIEVAKRYAEAQEEASKATANRAKAEDEYGKAQSQTGDKYDPAKVAEYARSIEELGKKEESAKAKVDGLSKELEIAKQRLEKGADTTKYSSLIAILDQLKSKVAIVHQQDATPKFDDSVLKGMESGLKNVDAIAKSFAGIAKESAKVDVLSTALKEARSRVTELDNALKKDPGNKNIIAGRADAIKQAIALAGKEARALADAMSKIPSDKIDKTAISTGRVAELFSGYKRDFEDAVVQMRALAEAQKNVVKQMDEMNKKGLDSDDDKQKIADLRAEYDRLAKAIQDVVQKGDVAFDGMVTEQATQTLVDYNTRIGSLQGIVAELNKTADETHEKDATPKIDSAAFMQATQMISQAARRMASEVVQSSNEIDAAYRDMRKTVQGSETDLENLKKSAIEYSQTHITSADTMLEMQALGGQLGILIEDLEEFGKITSNLDISTNMDAEDIALRLGQVANVLDLDIEGMQGFSDALVRLGNNMPTQESNIMNIAQRFAAVANTANFSGSEILAWSAAIASTGQRSEMAATAIGNTVSAIEQSLADGGEGFNAFATVAQMSAKDFEKAWKDDPTEALKAFIEGLRTLKDSQESAVATLENMGITGVRQQQTLLGLSNTVDKLGDALKMSEDAWNGVDDQWGKAGDAAIEAGKKSEGFSGALAILQNNAKDLAQVFGDSLVEPMKAVSAVLNVVTDAMNAMPGPVRSLITLVGGASLAFSTVAPVVKVFTTGLDALLKSTAASNGNLGAFITNVLGIGKAAEGASVGVKALHASVNMLTGVAVVTGFLAVVAAISSFINEVNTLRDATDGLEDSLDSMNDKYDEYASGASSAAESTSEFHKRMRDVISDQAALSDRISEKWGELGTNAAVIDEIVQKIEDLTSKEKLNSDEQAELAEAVRRYNDATGASVSVIEAQTGKLSMNTAELEKNAEAVKKRAESEAAYEMYKDTYKQRIQDQKAAEEAAKRFNEALEKSNGISKLNVIGMQVASAELATIKRDYDDLTKSVESADDMLSMLSKSMNGTQEITKEMSKALIDANESTKDLDNLTKDELDYVVAHWDGTAQSVIDAIKTIKDHAAEASAISEAMSEGSKKAAKERAAALKKELDAEYKEMKRQLDAEYKDQQREYDREYKARQKSLDAKYKQAQKGYDAEYKAQQKAFDKAYKQLQKALDAEYKAQQKAFSDEYNSVKKVLDNEYNAVKKELDREYSAKKSGYDDQLKALKKAQDAEVDAFNKATDAKLKAMEREYKEKLRLLELEYGQYDKGIDEQVKALKEETEAEKKAIEERNQNDKIAELQRDVEKANSRRKRAEAEKALNDYIQEVEQKRNEDARALEEERLKETQEALKDELQQRKDALKEQYDSEVAAYKEKRSVELEALKEANQAEYDARKEQYDLDLEQLKEAQSIRLEAIKEAQTAELEALKEYQSAQLEAIKEDQSAQLETVKENQTAQLEALKESQTAALENLKDSQQQELDALKQHQQDQLEAMKQNHQEQLDEQKAANDKRVEEVKSGNATEESEQKKSNQKKSDEQKRANREAEEEQERAKEKSLESHRKWAHEEAAEWRKRVGAAGEAGNETGKQYSEGINYWFPNLQRDVENAINNLSDNMEGPSLKSYNWGADMISNFASGVNFYWDHYGAPGIVSIAQFMADFLGFSVPKKGPLHHQDEWGGHFVENIIDGIKSKEDVLYDRVEKMARTVEEGFDPTLTVDAAYEAIDAINKGRSASMAQLVAEGKSGDIKIEVNISDVSVRSDADIDRLASEVSRRMADQLRRQQAGRL